MTDDTHTDDGDESASSTRRELLKGGAVGLGLLTLGSGGVSAQSGVGGGSASDEMAHLRQLVYGGPLGERADPGVDGRVYWADDGTIAKDDGSGWQKPDLKGLGSVGTEDATIGTYEARDSPSKSDLQDLINNSDGDIYINVTGTVTDNSRITVQDTRDREVVVDAYGATIDISDSIVLDIKTNRNTSTNDFPLRFALLGGTLRGDGTSSSKAVQVTDHFGYYLAPSKIENVAQRGFFIRNVDWWSESGTIKYCDDKDVADELLHFAGATATGGSGTDSFRDTKLEVFGGYNAYGLYQSDANLYGSQLNLELNSGAASSVGWRVDGSLRNTEWNVNIEGAGDGIVLDTVDQSGMGVYRFGGSGTELTDNTGNGATTFIYWRNTDSGAHLYDSGTEIWQANDYRIKNHITTEMLSKLQIKNDSPVEFHDENGDIITLRANSGELEVVDSAGNITTLS